MKRHEQIRSGRAGASKPSVRLAALLLLAASASAQIGPPPGVPPVPVPPGNPITVAKANLGKALFWDEQLSSPRTISCGTCHIPAVGGSDPRSALVGPISLHPGPDGVAGTADDVRGSPGVVGTDAANQLVPTQDFPFVLQVTGRKAPSMINAAFAPSLFWDGRAGGVFSDPVSGALVLPFGGALESQAVGPPVSSVEMAHAGRDWNEVATRIASSSPLVLAQDIPVALADWIAGRNYPQLFAEAFGTPAVTPTRIALAIATYERTLISDEAPWDAFIAGNAAALTPLQQQGQAIFNGPGRCNICHVGPLFTDQQFHALGVRPPGEDPGLGALTGLPQDQGKFKTPSLRNVALRGPYFHTGSLPSLAAVVAFYDRGGDFLQNQDPAIIPLGLNPQQQNALVAFLGALTDPRVAAESAPFDRPTLYGGSERVPAPFGVGGAGTGGFIPLPVAQQPPLLGNPSLMLGLGRGLGGAPVLLGFDVQSSPPGTTVLGTPLHLALSPSFQLLSLGLLEGNGAGAGFTSFAVAVPNEPAAVGVELVLQWFVLDPGAPAGLASSRGLRLEFFAPTEV
ncbi:MAG: cytochrome-c peroxidase [Planctomycetota bacterium]